MPDAAGIPRTSAKHDEKQDVEDWVLVANVDPGQGPHEGNDEADQQGREGRRADIREPPDLLSLLGSGPAEPQEQADHGEEREGQGDEPRRHGNELDGPPPPGREAEGVDDRTVELGEPRIQGPGCQRETDQVHGQRRDQHPQDGPPPWPGHPSIGVEQEDQGEGSDHEREADAGEPCREARGGEGARRVVDPVLGIGPGHQPDCRCQPDPGEDPADPVVGPPGGDEAPHRREAEHGDGEDDELRAVVRIRVQHGEHHPASEGGGSEPPHGPCQAQSRSIRHGPLRTLIRDASPMTGFSPSAPRRGRVPAERPAGAPPPRRGCRHHHLVGRLSPRTVVATGWERAGH